MQVQRGGRQQMGDWLSAAVIGTRRLLLTPMRAADAGEMTGVLDDERLHEFTGGSPDSPAERRARYARLLAGSPDPAVSWLNWIVRLRGSGQAVGTVQATVTGGGGSAGGGQGTGNGLSAEVAWVIGRPWQGHGYAAEAAAGLAGWLLSEGATVITARIHPDHHASAGVAARAGLAVTDDVIDGERVWRLTATGPGG
jgi:RimJ/RimL family protein N-acetyltransferase